MRLALAIISASVLAACEAQPAPVPEPILPNPILAATEADRREHLAGPAAEGDFKVKFGEPFITFENRGDKLAITQPNAQPAYVVIDAVRSMPYQGAVQFIGKSRVIDPEQPFVLTVERGRCRSAFSGERTHYVAYLGTDAEPTRLRTCASPAR